MRDVLARLMEWMETSEVEDADIVLRDAITEIAGLRSRNATTAPDESLATAMAQASYYARRAGYLEGALLVISWGTSGVDPQEAATRALDGVGEDEYARRLKLSKSDKP